MSSSKLKHTYRRRPQMSSCLWHIESYDLTVFDFRSITCERVCKERKKLSWTDFGIYIETQIMEILCISTKGLGSSCPYGQCPVDAEVQGNQDEVVEEEVNGFGPALYRSVSPHLDSTSATQLGEEEGAEGVNLQFCRLAGTPLHHQGEVEVDHLW